MLALVGGALVAGVLLIDVGVVFAASELQSYGDDTAVAKTLLVVSWNWANLYAPAFMALLAGGAGALFARDALPRWFRWASIGLLVVKVLILVVIQAPGLATAPGMIWIVLASLVLASTTPRQIER